jgi:uncharacterized protein
VFGAFGFLRLHFLPVLLACLAITLPSFALQVPPLEGRINDRAALLSPAIKQRLTERLVAYENATGHQLAVLTIPSLEGDPIEDFSIRVVESWKLGKKSKDDGILVLVVYKDRKMRIEVGYGLEGELPDAAAGRIVRDVMVPRFRSGDYEGGIAAAVDAVIQKTGGQAATSATPSDAPRNGTPARPLGLLGRILSGLFKLAFFGIFGFIFLIVWLLNRLGGRRSGGMFFSGGGYGGGSGGGFGGGGFSGGGGGFGGGGASGGW